MNAKWRAAALVVLAGGIGLGCPGAQVPATTAAPRTPNTAAQRPKEPVVVVLSKTGLGFRLRDADEELNDAAAQPAPASALTAADAKLLFDRLPPQKAGLADVRDFALGEKTLLPPRPGETVKEPFPPPATHVPPSPVAPDPLRVTRHEPDGDVSLAPYLNVTFSAPMVPVTSHGDLAKVPVPIKLTPEPPGRWRWIGAQTALFQPAPRFPMATDFAVDIPAGTRSAAGGTLAEAQHYTFSTPAPKLEARGPLTNTSKLTPTIYARFDQAIDPGAILAAMRVTQNGNAVQVRIASQEEADADEAAARLRDPSDAALKKQLLVKPVVPFERDADIGVAFPPGTPSAEGPKKTAVGQSFHFHTYGPMRAVEHQCAPECTPFSSFTVRFTNPIDFSKFENKYVTVTPPIQDMEVAADESWIAIEGQKAGGTKYTVKVAKEITDVFGQTLDKEDTSVFAVGHAPSTLFSEDREVSVLEAGASPASLSVFSVNDRALRVRLYAVKPEDYRTFKVWRIAAAAPGQNPNALSGPPPGKLVVDEIVHPATKPDQLVETKIDLGPALHGGVGQVLVAVDTLRKLTDTRPRERVRHWVQVTRMGLHAIADRSDLVVWTTALADGAPLPGALVTSGTGSGAAKGTAWQGLDPNAAVTGPDGVARLRNNPSAPIVASKDKDLTFLPDGLNESGGTTLARFFAFDDRKTYRPGENVHVKGWVRNVGYSKGGDVSLLPDSSNLRIHWIAEDSERAELSKGDANVDALGGFDFVVTTPKNANLGWASVSLDIPRYATGQHGFEIQEFRRPEFEVRASATPGPLFVGEHAIATVDAKYYSGGGLPGADVTWTVSRKEAAFVPPNRGEYAFGNNELEPWVSRTRRSKANPTSESWKGRTDGRGTHRMRVDFDALEPAYPMSLTLTARVMDVNRQEWSSTTSMLVHPASVAVGLKLDKSFAHAGDSIGVDELVVDLTGKASSNHPVTVTSTRLEWQRTSSGYEEKEVDEQTCSLTSGEVAKRCSLPTSKGGRYRLKAITTDEFGRKSQTVTRLWVTDRVLPPDSHLRPDTAEVVADQKTYAPGENAELLVVAPFVPAEGMLVLARGGILSTRRFSMTSAIQTLEVKLDAALTPNVNATIILAGAASDEVATGPPGGRMPPRPAFATGTVSLSIPPVHRTLDVSVVPRDAAVVPGARTTIDVDVKDWRGETVPGAEVALLVVDEAVLALSDVQLPDPVGTFYPQRAAGVLEGGTRALLTLATPRESKLSSLLAPVVLRRAMARQHTDGWADDVGEEMETFARTRDYAPAPAALVAAGLPRMPNTSIAVRTDFSALAVFEPALKTDARGHLEVPVNLPDSLTRYRVRVVAAAGANAFGARESTLVARLPLMARPSPPRFLNYGDRFELPVVVQNQTDRPLRATVGLRAINARVVDAPAKRVDVPANDRVEVRFSVAADRPGKAAFQIGAAAGTLADAADIDLPVWTPATTESFATYGVVDAGAIAQPVAMPASLVSGFGGLEVTTSSTALQGLTDALLYLVRYPFECNEQISSRMLAVASLRDVLSAFHTKDMPAASELEASVTADLERLKARQTWGGGWGFWGSGEESPFVSIHVAHAIARVEARGYKIDPTMKQRAQSWLRSVESHIPSYYSAEARRALVAYSLYVRRLMKDADPAAARRLIRDSGGVDNMDLEAVGWIWPTLSEDPGSQAENADVRRLVGNRVTETAGAAHFVTSYGDADYLLLHSDRRADGVLLEALMVDQPQSDLVPKLVKGLLAHRTAGRWASTQENAFVLLALDAYFQKYEEKAPDFVARVWLGDRFAGDHAFKGRSTDYREIDVPMGFLADLPRRDLTLAKEGPGRLYYRIGMRYAPADLRPPPIDQGFTVARSYEAVDDDADVKRDDAGVWHFRAGKKVRTRVTMVLPARRYHVALVDPIAAGVEPMNPELAVTGAIPQDPKAAVGRAWYWESTWYAHQNMRDDRVEAFAPLVWEGVHEYVYTSRATTPGVFVVPPPRAEEMYSPEVFGRGATDTVVVQ